MTRHIVKAGDLAYYDTFSGLVPVKVLSIKRDGDELVAELRVTGERGAYKRGEILNIRPTLTLVSRAQRIVRSGQYRLIGQVIHVPDDAMAVAE
jgi:hypothetical protein